VSTKKMQCKYMDGECDHKADFILIQAGDLEDAKLNEIGYPVVCVVPICKQHVDEFGQEYIRGEL
jgi:hypothetical protein